MRNHEVSKPAAAVSRSRNRPARRTKQGTRTLPSGPLNRVEAGGIEPPSRDNSNGGLYMLSRLFNLGAGGGKRHSPPEPSRLYLVR